MDVTRFILLGAREAQAGASLIPKYASLMTFIAAQHANNVSHVACHVTTHSIIISFICFELSICSRLYFLTYFLLFSPHPD